MNFFDFVKEIHSTNITLDQFKIKYNSYFTDNDYEETSIFTLKNIEVFGYDGISLVTMMPEYNFKMIVGIPNYESLDSLSRYESAEKCHKKMITLFGKPSKTQPISHDNPIQNQIYEKLNITDGVTYFWRQEDDRIIASSTMKTEKEEMYMILFITMDSSPATSVPVQRKFFKTLELGEAISKQQIATSLEIDCFFYRRRKNIIRKNL